MPRITLDLNKAADRDSVKAVWRRAVGLEPGAANQGLVAEGEPSSARLADYDDSGWEICDNVREFVSTKFTFAWYRISIELPQEVEGVPVQGATVAFETNIDDYGEVWVDGEIDYTTGVVQGYNRHQRVIVTADATPGARHVIACLAANGPLAAPRGGVFMRYVTLAIETRGP